MTRKAFDELRQTLNELRARLATSPARLGAPIDGFDAGRLGLDDDSAAPVRVPTPRPRPTRPPASIALEEP